MEIKGSATFLPFCLERLLKRRSKGRGIKKVKQENSKQFYEITMKFVIEDRRKDSKTKLICNTEKLNQSRQQKALIHMNV